MKKVFIVLSVMASVLLVGCNAREVVSELPEQVSETVENTKNYIERLSKNMNQEKLPEKLGLAKEVIENIPVYCYRGSINDNNKKLLYIHGGSYIEEASYFQLNLSTATIKPILPS